MNKITLNGQAYYLGDYIFTELEKLADNLGTKERLEIMSFIKRMKAVN